MNRFLVLCVILVVSAAALIAQAEMVVNGDFENTTGWGAVGSTDNPANWPPYDPARKNPAAQQSGTNAIGGSGTSAYMPADYGVATADRKDMANTLGEPVGPLFQLDFDFASEDPGGDEDRSLTGAVYTSSGASISWRVVDLVDGDGVGDLQFYHYPSSVRGWYTVLEGVVTFDDDVTTTPLVNHFCLIGHYDDDNSYYEVTMTNASGQSFNATNLTYCRPGTIPSGDKLAKITFNTFNSKGDYLLDNVAIPEPGAALLLAIGLLCLAGRRKRN